MRQAPARWLIIYAIISTAVLIGGAVAIRNRDRVNDERDERIAQVCTLAKENRAAVLDVIRDDTPLPTIGIPVADALIADYNSDISARAERIARRFQHPLISECSP